VTTRRNGRVNDNNRSRSGMATKRTGNGNSDCNSNGNGSGRCHTFFRFTSAEEADDEDCEDCYADCGVEAVAFDGEADDSEGHAGDGGGDQKEDA
jgi:hypothetical protein